MAGESLSLSELREWYAAFDAVVAAHGGGALSTLGVPDGGKVVTSDINNLYNQITAFREDTYFKTEPSLYATDYSIIGSGTVIRRNAITPIETTVTGIARIKCRNEATNTSGTCGSGTCGSGTCGSGTCGSGGDGITNSWTNMSHGTQTHGTLTHGACTRGDYNQTCASGTDTSGTCTNRYYSQTCNNVTKDVICGKTANVWSCVCMVTYRSNVSDSSGTHSSGTNSRYCSSGRNNVTCASGDNARYCGSGTNSVDCGSGTNGHTRNWHTTCSYNTYNHGTLTHGTQTHGTQTHGSKAHSTIIDILNSHTTKSN